MGKKQRERKEKKMAQRPQGSAPPSWMNQALSPEAQRVMEKLAQLNPHMDEAVFTRALMNSTDLRDEPELRDFELDADAVGRAINRLMPKYEPRLQRAKQRSQDEFETTYDELRIEAMDMALTREQRREFLKRYDAMLTRLMQGRDTKRLETAIITRTMLGSREFPWGAQPILTSMFEDAKTAQLERFQQAEQLLQKLVQNKNGEPDTTALQELLQHPERMEELARTLDIPSELYEKMEEMSEEVLEEFRNGLFAGELELDLFSDEELQEFALSIDAFMSEHRLAAKAELSPEAGKLFIEILGGQLDEMMTEERFAQMEHDMERIEGEWFAEGVNEATLLRIERKQLRDFEPAENRFLISVLFGQLRRASEQEDDKEEQAADETPINVTAFTDFRERIGGIFKRK